MADNIKVTIRRREAARYPGCEKPWQADVTLDNGNDFHGIGASPAEALYELALYWNRFEGRLPKREA